MKTHELAKALSQFAHMLRSAPDFDVAELRLSSVGTPRRTSSAEIAVNLSTLAELARIDRRQWLAFIEDNDLPIDVRRRDASRDILGKLLKYLDENDLALEQLKKRVIARDSKASPELAKALSFLLGDPSGTREKGN